jgi:hypothetical protein
MMKPAIDNEAKSPSGTDGPVRQGTRNGRMTSALWSCELHQKISLAPTPTSLKLESLLVELQKIEDESIRHSESPRELTIR